ncbi:efflux RND transporter periplasmic adaptor subunit [Arenibaculum pallidiluteum]|uniref:efflux RND transporter periplasmic adaptor subunit n=1 Tax=Arenibaculum pallidiluteum TaxID=2812559 RepID=UPI001A97C0EE|nr:HlyD family efflux transporter periplasmic adaptor subunit [Arenibaculum pallidiluteum]
MSESLNRQLLRLSTLLQLEHRARGSTADTLPFLIVNETASVLPYRQAVLWQAAERRGGRIVATSGVALHDPDGPYLRWLSQLFAVVSRTAEAGRIHAIAADALTDHPGIAREWADWLPRQALWVPMVAPGGIVVGALLLVRDEPWTEADEHVLEYLCGAYAHSWILAHQTGRLPWAKRPLPGKLALALVAALFAAGFYPVRQSVLAPAEIVPRDPVLVRAPIEGIVDRFEVQPYEAVRSGQALFAIDDTQLRSRLKVSIKAREIAQAEYLQAAQLAVVDPKAKARLSVLQAKVEQQNAEVALVQALLERVRVSAPRDGVAVFDDVNDWTGKPVTVGERVMLLADPAQVALEIRVPVGEALPIDVGAEALFFLNVAPDAPVAARVDRIGYRTSPDTDGTLSYRLKAGFEGQGEGLRIGLKGTAKIYGEEAPLALWALRRPIAAVRQWLGL